MKALSPLVTDLYQLTMAYGYWKSGKAAQQAVFHLFFRRGPFGAGCAIAAGLEQVIQSVTSFHFTEEDLSYLKGLSSASGAPLFEQEFLDYLAHLRFTGTIDAVPEGTVVFPQEPILRIEGNMIECQLLETMMLNLINFQTLIATKAARICLAAEGDGVLEFGLRRAQGPNGALLASRAAYIGGCHATSHVEAGKVWGIPVRGTHGHSWVMSFETEEEAFRTYAEAMPENCILLVDTYNTIEGVRTAIRVGKELEKKGGTFSGIRLDSGDLAQLSIKSRALLDAAGFTHTRIVASNDLDEYRIKELKANGARIDLWGVGTRLATAADDPALGGVYKLALVQNDAGKWQPRMKISSSPGKSSLPGRLQVIRKMEQGQWISDEIVPESEPVPEGAAPLLIPIIQSGQLIGERLPLSELRERASSNIRMFRKFLEGEKITIPVAASIQRDIDQIRNSGNKN